MTLTITNGQILINKSGITRLNTDDKLLHGTSQGMPIAGTVNIPDIQGGDSNDVGPGRRDLTNVYDLGAVTSGHTQLIGAAKFNFTGLAANGAPFNRWTMVMGGSLLWLIDGEAGFQDAVGDNYSPPSQFVDYHFRISGGRAQMVQRVFLKDTPGLYTVLSHSITYKLRSGNWT